MTHSASEAFQQELRCLIVRYQDERIISAAEIAGALECLKFEVIHQCYEIMGECLDEEEEEEDRCP